MTRGLWRLLSLEPSLYPPIHLPCHASKNARRNRQPAPIPPTDSEEDPNFNTNGSFSYTPQYHYVGADSFVYRLTNGSFSDDATVSIGVMNMAPVAVNDTYGTRHDVQLTVQVPGVRYNDYDPNGDPTTAALVTGPAHSQSFTFNADGSFTYVPALHY